MKYVEKWKRHGGISFFLGKNFNSAFGTESRSQAHRFRVQKNEKNEALYAFKHVNSLDNGKVEGALHKYVKYQLFLLILNNRGVQDELFGAFTCEYVFRVSNFPRVFCSSYGTEDFLQEQDRKRDRNNNPQFTC